MDKVVHINPDVEKARDILRGMSLEEQYNEMLERGSEAGFDKGRLMIMSARYHNSPIREKHSKEFHQRFEDTLVSLVGLKEEESFDMLMFSAFMGVWDVMSDELNRENGNA